MSAVTKEKLEAVKEEARNKGLNPILECKKVAGEYNLNGLAICEELNQTYLLDGPVKSLLMELEKCRDHGYCDPLYLEEKLRLTTYHMSDLMRMTDYGDSSTRTVRDSGRSDPHGRSI